MVTSISLKELSELIITIQLNLKNKSSIESDVVNKLHDIVRSSREAPEEVIVLRNVIKLISYVYDSGKDVGNEQDDQFFLLITDCIDCLYDLLKRNGTGKDDLCNEAVNAILVISQRNSQAPNILLKSVSNTLISILIYAKFELKVKKDFLKALNFILENSDRKLRYKIRNDLKLEKLSKLLYTCGDYDFQINILETLFRYTSIEDRKVYAKKWLNDKSNLVSAFLDITDFEPDCRKFLNVFNSSLTNDRLVYSIPCTTALIGNYEVKKPEHPDYGEFWVDFNLGSRSVSLVCSQESLFSNSVLANQIVPELWETILVESNIVNKVKLQKYSLPMASQGHEEDFWEMRVVLFQPCYAVFSSFPCNFEGNICIFNFPNSVVSTLHMVLQKLFPDNYFYELNPLPGTVKMIRNKSSVSSFNDEIDSELCGKIPNVNETVEKVMRHPMRINNSQEKEKISEITLEGKVRTPLGPQTMGNNFPERIIAKNVFSKRKAEASQKVERLSTLSSRSKAPKSPFKPLEIVISPSHMSKKLNYSEKIPIVPTQNSTTAHNLQDHPKGLEVIKENISSLSISSPNKADEVCISNPPSTKSQPSSIKNNETDNAKEISFSKESSCDKRRKENDSTLVRNFDCNNLNSKTDNSKRDEIKNKATCSSEIKESSQNNPSGEIFHGRVLRSHKRTQDSQENNKDMLSIGKKNETKPAQASNTSPSSNLTMQKSGLIDLGLSETDSDTSWLKTHRIKSNVKLANKRRTQSLGALHLKQLYNKEVATAKARSAAKESYNKLKPTHSRSNENESKRLPCKKKLFNCNDQSFLGPKTNDSNNSKIIAEKLNKQSDARNNSSGKDMKTKGSVLPDNWFSETESEFSWLKPGYKEKRLATYTNQRKLSDVQEKGKELHKKLMERDKRKDNDTHAENDENDIRKTGFGKSRTVPKKLVNFKSTENSVNAATKRHLEKDEGNDSKLSEESRYVKKKEGLVVQNKNITENENSCQTREIDEERKETSPKQSESDTSDQNNIQISGAECKQKLSYKEQEKSKKLGLVRIAQNKTVRDSETIEVRSFSNANRSKKLNDNETELNIQNECTNKNLEKSQHASESPEKSQTENGLNVGHYQLRQQFTNKSKSFAPIGITSEINPKFPFTKHILDSYENQESNNSDDESVESSSTNSQPENLNTAIVTKRNESIEENDRNGHHPFSRKRANKVHDTPLSNESTNLSSPNNYQELNRINSETNITHLNTPLSENNSNTSKSKDNESSEEGDDLIPLSIPECNSTSSSHFNSSFFSRQKNRATREISKKFQLSEREDKNTNLKKMSSKIVSSHLPSLPEEGSNSDLDINIDLSESENDKIEKQDSRYSISNNSSSFGMKRKDSKVENYPISRTTGKRVSEAGNDAPQRNLSTKKSKLIQENLKNISLRSCDLHVSKKRENNIKPNTPTSDELQLEILIADTSLTLEKALNTFQEKDPSYDALPCEPSTSINILYNTLELDKEESKKRKCISQRPSVTNTKSKKRKMTEPMSIQNRKINDNDWDTFSHGLNENHGNKSKKPNKRQADSLKKEHIQEMTQPQADFSWAEAPNIQQLVKMHLSEKIKSLEELGNYVLQYAEEAMNNMEEDNHKLWKEMTSKYLRKINNEINNVEETLKKLDVLQARFAKCLTYFTNTCFMKADNELLAKESLRKIQILSEDMKKECKKDGSNNIDRYKSILSPKIKLLHSNYMQKEKKKEMAKMMARLHSLFSL